MSKQGVKGGGLMLISAAGLIIDVMPKYDLLRSRVKEYIYEGAKKADIIVRVDDEFLYEKQKQYPHLTLSECEYIYTSDCFYRELLLYDGFLLHASAVALEDYAYLFSAPSGTGKSTHTHLWLNCFGEKAFIINDDKPAIRLIDGHFYACGTPWSGKTDESKNMHVPLKAIAYIKRSNDNYINKAAPEKAIKYILEQTIRPGGLSCMDKLLLLLDKLLKEIPVYELHCNISEEAVITAYNTMKN